MFAVVACNLLFCVLLCCGLTCSTLGRCDCGWCCCYFIVVLLWIVAYGCWLFAKLVGMGSLYGICGWWLYVLVLVLLVWFWVLFVVFCDYLLCLWCRLI